MASTLRAPEVRSGDAASILSEQPSLRATARLLLGSLSFWQIAVAAFFRYGTFVSLQGVWLGMYLMDARGLTPVQAGNVIIILSVGNVCGGPIGGMFVDRVHYSEKQVVFTGLVVYSLALLMLTGVWKVENTHFYIILSFS